MIALIDELKKAQEASKQRLDELEARVDKLEARIAELEKQLGIGQPEPA